PFGCMHGNLTTAVFQKIEAELGVPVINIFYDGEREVNGIIKDTIRNKQKDVDTTVRARGYLPSEQSER
ncbi:MAG TPA: hypothetical protein VI584_03230, partial [Nitrospiria bacterium]|nr:hypothetical protein [Nitrospiria bacterium]